MRGPSGGPLPLDDIRSLVMYAAYDAGLDGADEVTLRTLRHTYLVYLLRQGIRFADIGRIVGRLPQDELTAYMRFAPSQPRLPLEQIDLVLPGFAGHNRMRIRANQTHCRAFCSVFSHGRSRPARSNRRRSRE